MVGNTHGIVNLRLVHNLPFVSVEVSANNRSVSLHNVIIDTGSAGSIFSADKMLDLGLVCSGSDELYIISGVGGEEYVFSKTVASVRIGHLVVNDFKIEVGAMDYGFEFDGIIGMSFLLATKAKLDCEHLTLS